ncbi:IMPACT family protein [Teredinibacter haidensis]|uniref:IMPACT family protein n=1 Tax=Teredinibacter haidensis TaxID=2731755 RepID=UPI0009489B87|nr:YigZ family protein [Teredinibacter haidensis]
MSTSYQQLAAPEIFEFEEKRSRFICHLFPVVSREQSLQHLEELRSQYPDARHHCWAYLVGNAQQPKTQAYSDDGEPSGTAGKPILNVLTQRHAGDSCAIVVRYFGGVKLGAGGLVRAYSAVVSQALDKARLIAMVPTVEFGVEVAFHLEAITRRIVAEYGGEILNAEYNNQVLLTIQLALECEQMCKDKLQHAASGGALFKKAENKKATC